MDSFEHDPLDLTKPGIRLLRLLKGCTGPIRCELFEVDVAERSCEPPYEALSYVWGSSDLTHHIEISGKELRITASLHLALSHLRLADDRVLWVDAVCINQNNHKERGHQVQRMGDIYSQARQVIVWLGQSTDNTDAFMNAMQRLQAEMERPGSPYRNWVPHYTDDMDWPGKWHHRWRKHVKDEFSHLMEYKDGTSYTDSDSYEYGIGYSSERRPDTDFTSARDGLIDLLHRAWFRRIWILQEVANASALIFHCGRFSIPALYFTVGPEIINSYRGHGVILNGQCQAVIDIMPTHRLTSNSWWERGRTMYSLLKHFCQSQATDPRDMIYALRGISTDITKCGFPTVDYEVSEEVLAKRMSYFMFHCDLTSWARLDTISDLIAQLDWLLAASVTVHSGSSQDADLSQLLDNGYIRITSYIMQVPFESGHWVLIDRLLSRPKTSISTEAVRVAYQICDAPIPEIVALKSNISGSGILYAALQNRHMGPQLIDGFWETKQRGGRRYAGRCSVKVLGLLWGYETHKPHPTRVTVHANCLAALLSQMIRSRRNLKSLSLFWKSQEGESLLGYAIKTGNFPLSRDGCRP